MENDVFWWNGGVYVERFGKSLAEIFGQGFFFCPDLTCCEERGRGGLEGRLLGLGEESGGQFLGGANAVGAFQVDADPSVCGRVGGIKVGMGKRK